MSCSFSAKYLKSTSKTQNYQTQWSRQLVLESPSKAKSIYLQVVGDGVFDEQNTAIFRELLRNNLVKKDYLLSKVPEKAMFILQLRLKQSGKISIKTIQAALQKGYGMDFASQLPMQQSFIPKTIERDDFKKYLEPKFETNLTQEELILTTNKSAWQKILTMLKMRNNNLNTDINQDLIEYNSNKMFSIIADMQVLSRLNEDWKQQQTRIAVSSKDIQQSKEKILSKLINLLAEEVSGVF